MMKKIIIGVLVILVSIVLFFIVDFGVGSLILGSNTTYMSGFSKFYHVHRSKISGLNYVKVEYSCSIPGCSNTYILL